MSTMIREVMTKNPIAYPVTAKLSDVARSMHDADVGSVVVTENGKPCGVLTDRDMVIRAIAEGRDPALTTAGEVCTHQVTTVSAGETLDYAVKLMREKAIRRLPVMDNGKLVGVVSIGDLARRLDRKSALADISAAPAQH